MKSTPFSTTNTPSCSDHNYTAPREADIYPSNPHTYPVFHYPLMQEITVPFYHSWQWSLYRSSQKCFNLLYPQISSSKRCDLEVIIEVCLNLQLRAVATYYFYQKKKSLLYIKSLYIFIDGDWCGQRCAGFLRELGGKSLLSCC